MKKKIVIWCALFALLVALVPPSSARANITEATADDVKYTDIEDYMHSSGYTSFVKKEGYLYIVTKNAKYNNSECFVVHEIYKYYDENNYKREPFIALNEDDSYIYILGCLFPSNHHYYYVPEVASKYDNYSVVKTDKTVNSYSSTYGTEFVYSPSNCWISGINFKDTFLFQDVVYCDLPIYKLSGIVPKTTFPDLSYDNVVYEGNAVDKYSFPLWCADASLNCLSSTNESASKIPYSYNGYYHIVRKTSAGKWLLTTIGNSLGQQDLQLRYSEDLGSMIIYNTYNTEETSGDAINGYLVNVRQYEYDTDGWKVRTYETFDAREYENGIIELGAGTGVDSTRVMAYTNTDIYSYNGYAIMYEASTEYVDIEDSDSGSGSDSSEDGGSGSTGGGSSGGSRGDSYGILSDNWPVYSDCSDTSEIFGYLNQGDVVELLEVYNSSSYTNLWFKVSCTIDDVAYVGWINGGIDYDVSATPTPTPTHSGGGRPGLGGRPTVDIGGEAVAGSGLDFIITLFSMLWSRLFSISMNIDGYSISFQQIIVYGLLVGIIIGAVKSFIGGKKP